MATSPLVDRSRPPDEASLSAALGRARAHWDALLARAESAGERVTREWKFYGPRHGWQLKLSARKRALLYMIPEERSFVAALALPAGALAAMGESGLPAALVKEIEEARPAPEGRPARVQVKSAGDVAAVATLLRLKRAAGGAARR